jgi:hypothetical protein
MRKCIALAVFAVILASSCQEEKPQLPPEKLAPVLAELHLADVYSGMLQKPGEPSHGKNLDSLATWTRAILASHHISRDELTQSMDWYRDRPAELDSLYAKVLPLLEQMRTPTASSPKR